MPGYARPHPGERRPGIELREAVVNRQDFDLKRLILMHDLSWIGSLGVTPYDMEGLLGLELRQNLLNPWHQHLKRLLDLALGIIFGLLAIPVIGLIGLIVRLDSVGPAFYRHSRVGKGGHPLMIWKFRTMRTDGEQVLKAHLEKDPLARGEWLETQKLKHDPRLTGLGRFLRRTSLDEMPQIWNVLRGEMSLVGPRPIVEREIAPTMTGATPSTNASCRASPVCGRSRGATTWATTSASAWTNTTCATGRSGWISTFWHVHSRRCSAARELISARMMRQRLACILIGIVLLFPLPFASGSFVPEGRALTSFLLIACGLVWLAWRWRQRRDFGVPKAAAPLILFLIWNAVLLPRGRRFFFTVSTAFKSG